MWTSRTFSASHNLFSQLIRSNVSSAGFSPARVEKIIELMVIAGPEGSEKSVDVEEELAKCNKSIFLVEQAKLQTTLVSTRNRTTEKFY